MDTKSKFTWMVILSAVLLVAPSAMAAASLGFGVTHTRPGLTASLLDDYTVGGGPFVAGPPFTFALLDTCVSQSVAVGLLVDAIVTSEVYSWDDGLGASGLIFTYAVSVAGSHNLDRMAIGSGDWVNTSIIDNGVDSIVAGSSTFPGGAGTEWDDGVPAKHIRDLASGGGSLTIEYWTGSDGTILFPGDSSARSWFQTDAEDYKKTSISLQDGGAAGEAQVFAPIPAPGAVLLGAMGLGLVGWVKRRLA